MEIQYPSWAPDVLCKHHKIVLGHINNKKSKMKRTKGFEIMESLIFNEEMKRVWPIIKRYSESGYLKNMVDRKLPGWTGFSFFEFNSYGFRLFHNVKYAYAYSLIKYKSKKVKKAFYNSVKKQASELSMLIEKTEFDYSPRRYYPEYFEYSDEGKILYEDGEAGFNFSNILQLLSDEAANFELTVDTETQVLPYPNIKNSQRTAFIRVLSLNFMEYYNSYLYRTQATLARCVLNDSGIDENTIKDALRNWSGDLNTIHEWNIIG